MTAEAEVDKAIAALQSSLRHSKENEQLTARLRDLMTACANLSREAETATQLSMKNEVKGYHWLITLGRVEWMGYSGNNPTLISISPFSQKVCFPQWHSLMIALWNL